MASQTAMIGAAGKADYGIWRVILASAAGTMIEWYDFFIFGSLVAVLSLKFYPPGNDIFAYIADLATFAVGFVVRPFGALFFGRIGDVVGRKYAFLATLSIMGGATALIGLLPTYKTEVLTAPRSPWQNPFVERLVGSIRRERLDHVIVWNERSLRRTLQNYFAYYQRSRTHLALGKDAPEPRAVEPPEQGRVVAIPQVGGLHH
jgi:hypothetical protein